MPICWIHHRAKAINSDTDAYQEEMVDLRNNYPEDITPTPRNLDRTTERNTRKLSTVTQPYVKGPTQKIKKKNICSPYYIKTMFRSGLILRKYLPSQSSNRRQQELRIFDPLQLYKGKTCHPLKVKLVDHRKAVVGGEIEKSDIADHI